MIQSPYGPDPSIEHQRDIFAKAIEDAVKKSGLIDPNAQLSGPELLFHLDTLAEICRQGTQ